MALGREFLATFKSVGADKLQRDFTKVAKGTETLDKGLDKTSQTSVRTQRRMGELGVSLKDLAKAGAGLAIGTWLGQGVVAAGQLETSMRGLSAVLGEATATDLQKWAEDSAGALNLTEAQALNAARGLATYSLQVEEAGGSSAQFTQDMVTLAAEVASFSGADPAAVIEALGGAMRGEFDTLQTYGVNLNAATVQAKAMELGLADTASALTDQDKLMATYAAALEQGSIFMGSTARNADTLTGQMADLKQQTSDLQTEIGSALVPSLSALAQVALTVLDVFNQLPGPIKALVLAFAGLRILGALASGPIETVRQALSNLRTDLGSTAGAAGKFKLGFSALRTAINPWALAIGAGVALLTTWISKNREAEAAAKEWAAGIDGVTGALNDQGEALLTEDLADFTDEAEAAGIALGDIAKAAVGTDPGYEQMLARLRDIQAEHTQALNTGRGMVVSLDEQGRAARELANQLENTRDKYEGGRKEAEASAVASEAVAGATEDVAAATKDYAAQQDKLRERIRETAAEYEELLDNFNAVNRAFIESKEPVLAYQGAIDDLAQSLVENKGNFSPDAAEGRSNWEALIGFAEAASGRVAEALENNGAKAAQTVYRNSRKTLHRMLVDAGLTSEAAWNKVNQVLKKPHTMSVKLDEADEKRLRLRLQKLREHKVEIKASAVIPPGADNQLANAIRLNTQEKLKPVQAKIDAVAEKLGLDTARGKLEETAEPDGKPRKAPIKPEVPPEDLAYANQLLDSITKLRIANIQVQVIPPPGGYPAGLGPTVGPSAMAGATASLLGSPVPTTGAVGGRAATLLLQPQAQPAQGPVQLAPRQTPVAVYLDGVEIASRIEARRALARTESVRRAP